MAATMKRFGIGLLLCAACTVAYGQAPVRLVQAWELSTGLNRPESVVYDAERDVLYVSNINGGAWEADGNGYIARVSSTGELLDSLWINELHAPKGLALFGDLLFVADLGELVAVDVINGAIAARYPVEPGTNLNDVAVDAGGTVYVTDSRDGRIYRLHEGRFGIWLEHPNIRTPNGIFALDEGLLIAAADSTAEQPGGARYLQVVSADGQQVRPLKDRTPQGALDAVEADGHGGYFLTDWAGGKILYATPEGDVVTLQEISQGTADLDYVADTGMLYLPVMMSNRLIAFRVER